MLHYISKGEMFIDVPPKKIICIFHDVKEKLTAFVIREKEGNQLRWAFEHLFQKLPQQLQKEWVSIRILLPSHDMYTEFKDQFEQDLNQSLDYNEPLFAFQFTYIPHLNEDELVKSQCVFLLRRYKRNKCLVKFQQIN